MAPEQIKGEVADRRTDVFALGIVLYELVTGHRLFKRFNQAGMARAVLSDSIVAPTRVEPSVPLALEAICMRALSRPREQRYATAAEMRRELLVAMRALASEEPSAELAELMVRSFTDRISDKRVLLRNVREGSVVDHVPVGDVDLTVDLPGIEEPPVGVEWEVPDAPALPLGLAHATTTNASGPMSTSMTSSPSEPAPTERGRSRTLWPLAVILVALTVVTAAGMRFVHDRRAAGRTSEPAPQQPSAAPAMPSQALLPPVEAIASASGSTSERSAPPNVAIAPSVAPAPSSRRRARPPATAPIVVTQPPPEEPPPPAPSASVRGFRRFQ